MFCTLVLHSLGIYDLWVKNHALEWHEGWASNTQLSSIMRNMFRQAQAWAWLAFTYLPISQGLSIVPLRVPGTLTVLPLLCRLHKATQDQYWSTYNHAVLLGRWALLRFCESSRDFKWCHGSQGRRPNAIIWKKSIMGHKRPLCSSEITWQ